MSPLRKNMDEAWDGEYPPGVTQESLRAYVEPTQERAATSEEIYDMLDAVTYHPEREAAEDLERQRKRTEHKLTVVSVIAIVAIVLVAIAHLAGWL